MRACARTENFFPRDRPLFSWECNANRLCCACVSLPWCPFFFFVDGVWDVVAFRVLVVVCVDVVVHRETVYGLSCVVWCLAGCVSCWTLEGKHVVSHWLLSFEALDTAVFCTACPGVRCSGVI